MKKIILATTISTLFAVSLAHAGTATGEIEFNGSVTNDACKITVNDEGGNKVVTLNTITTGKFGPAPATSGKLADPSKTVDLVTTGVACEQSILELDSTTAHPTIDGVFYAAKGADRIALYLEQAGETTGVVFRSELTPSATNLSSTPENNTATYNFKAHYYNEGVVPVVGNYTATVSYKVTNP